MSRLTVFCWGDYLDPLTQGVVGAALPSATACKDDIRLAALVGCIAGMAPDLDIFFRSSEDPLLMYEYHRHFTHSLAFVPVGALVVSLVLWPLLRRRLGFRKLYLFSFLGYLTHGLLDAFTSYGTHLVWPFSDLRTAWNSISVIDPVLSATMALLFIIGIVRRSRRWIVVGLIFAVSYLLLGVWQRERAQAAVTRIADQRGHQIERIRVTPSIGNILLWRGIYETRGRYHVDGIRLRAFSAPVIYEGGSVAKFVVQDVHPDLPQDSVLRRDLQRFSFFADDWIALHPHEGGSVVDMRYGALPNETTPLWGIKADPNQPDRHVTFENYRDFSDDRLEKLKAMLLARPVN
jgi:inner membrane protein